MSYKSFYTSYTIPHDSRGFKGSDRSIGLAGINCSMALACRRGIDDKKFRAGVARFRQEPALSSKVRFDPLPGDLDSLAVLLQQWHEGNLAGAAVLGLENLRELTAAKLAPYLPCYRLPAGDAVSVPDVLDALPIVAGVACRKRLPARPRKPRQPPLPFQQASPSGDVSWEDVEEFAEWHYSLQSLLWKALPWQRRGRRAYAQAGVANRIASDILGISVDIRVGTLVKADEVTAATRLAAGYSSQHDGDAIRLRKLVSAHVPKVRPRGRRYEAHLGSARGAAWSVALDRVLNDPSSWLRDASDRLIGAE